MCFGIGGVLALIPVFIIETLVLCLTLGLSLGAAAWAVVVANLTSTVAGVPLDGIGLRAVQLVLPLKADRFFEGIFEDFVPDCAHPFDKLSGWAVGVALVTVTLFCFISSWLVEWPVAVSMLDGLSAYDVGSGMFYANAASYVLLVVLVAIAGIAITVRARIAEKRRTAKEDEAKENGTSTLITLANSHPDWADVQISAELCRRGHWLSPVTVNTVLLSHGFEGRGQRKVSAIETLANSDMCDGIQDSATAETKPLKPKRHYKAGRREADGLWHQIAAE